MAMKKRKRNEEIAVSNVDAIGKGFTKYVKALPTLTITCKNGTIMAQILHLFLDDTAVGKLVYDPLSNEATMDLSDRFTVNEIRATVAVLTTSTSEPMRLAHTDIWVAVMECLHLWGLDDEYRALARRIRSQKLRMATQWIVDFVASYVRRRFPEDELYWDFIETISKHLDAFGEALTTHEKLFEGHVFKQICFAQIPK
jgi:hypothetical protein